MKKIVTLLLAAGLIFSAANKAQAVDISVGGEFIFGFGHVNTEYYDGKDGDPFSASQRLRTWSFFKASENVTGALFLEIGEQYWGDSNTGGQLGSDGKVVEVRRSYIDWRIPSADMKVRMGIQYFGLPEVAGGTAILGADAAGVSASYTINDNIGLSAAWFRPFDNGTTSDGTDNGDDEMDLFFMSMPMNFDDISLTPWAMYGAMGKDASLNWGSRVGLSALGTMPSAGRDHDVSMFWVGLPMKYKADAWNFELDLNYGSVGNTGKRTVTGSETIDIDNERSGWLVKGLAEYSMDFGVPGIFAWYGSGDDDDPSNGSEAMPYIGPSGTFTTFFGDAAWSATETGWGTNLGFDQMLGYSGTWGLGLQVRDLSFVDDLKHTLRVAYWHGTHDPENAKYLSSTAAVETSSYGNFYLTTDDYMVEFNVDSTYKIYENLSAMLQLGYAINGVDENTWDCPNTKNSYKAAVVVRYAF